MSKPTRKARAGKVVVILDKMHGPEAAVMGAFMRILAGMAPKPAPRRKRNAPKPRAGDR